MDDELNTTGSRWDYKRILGIIVVVLAGILVILFIDPRGGAKGTPEFLAIRKVAVALQKYVRDRDMEELPRRLATIAEDPALDLPLVGSHGNMGDLSQYYLYFPDGIASRSTEAKLILINASSITDTGRAGFGRYGAWLDTDNEIRVIRWMPEEEAQTYLQRAPGKSMP